MCSTAETILVQYSILQGQRIHSHPELLIVHKFWIVYDEWRKTYGKTILFTVIWHKYLSYPSCNALASPQVSNLLLCKAVLSDMLHTGKFSRLQVV